MSDKDLTDLQELEIQYARIDKEVEELKKTYKTLEQYMPQLQKIEELEKWQNGILEKSIELKTNEFDSKIKELEQRVNNVYTATEAWEKNMEQKVNSNWEFLSRIFTPESDYDLENNKRNVELLRLIKKVAELENTLKQEIGFNRKKLSELEQKIDRFIVESIKKRVNIESVLRDTLNKFESFVGYIHDAISTDCLVPPERCPSLMGKLSMLLNETIMLKEQLSGETNDKDCKWCGSTHHETSDFCSILCEKRYKKEKDPPAEDKEQEYDEVIDPITHVKSYLKKDPPAEDHSIIKETIHEWKNRITKELIKEFLADLKHEDIKQTQLDIQLLKTTYNLLRKGNLSQDAARQAFNKIIHAIEEVKKEHAFQIEKWQKRGEQP